MKLAMLLTVYEQLAGIERMAIGTALVVLAFLCCIDAKAQSDSTESADPVYARKIAILVGVGRYGAGESKGEFHNIPSVAKDLATLGDALVTLGFETRIYTDLPEPTGVSVPFRPLLKPSDPRDLAINSGHLGRLLTSLLEDLESTRERSLLLVYFSGHGGLIGKAERVMALPESTKTDPDSFYRVKRALYLLADRAPTADKYLIIDACAVKLAAKSEPSPLNLDEEVPTYLFSSKSGTPSFIDPELGQSVFTYYLVEAIRHAKELHLYSDGGTLDSESILKYLSDVVPKHRRLVRKDDGTQVSGAAQHPIGSSQKITLAASLNSEAKQAESPDVTNARIKILIESYGAK